MRRKVNNSETHETKRYYEVPSEKVQEWSDTIENLTKQRDQFKTERDTLIDDLSWYKAKVSRLEDGIKTLERKNEKLRKAHYNGWKQKDEVINNLISNIKSKDNLLSEISKHIGRKPASSTYKCFRAKLDSIGIKVGE